jgi:hypothetical protein
LKARQGFQRVRRQKLHFFRRGRLSGRGAQELKAQRKRLKAKAQGNQSPHKEMKIGRKEVKIYTPTFSKGYARFWRPARH